MKTFTSFLVTATTSFFILLFCYAAISKMLDFENFQVQIAQSPLLSAYAGFISYAVIVIEVVVVILLSIAKTKALGLYASTALMSAFTVYIYLILNYSDFVPCSCGGILEKMGWTEHMIFNIMCIVLGAASILLMEKEKHPSHLTTILLLATSNILSCAIVITLFVTSEYVIKKENNFQRRYLLHPISEVNNILLDNKSYYFAGDYNDSLYLGNRIYPLTITSTDTGLSKISKNYIQIGHPKFTFRNISLKIKGSHFYLSDGTVPVIFKGHIGNPNGQMISLGNGYFNSLSVIDSSTFAVRTQSASTQNFALGSLKLNRKPKFIMHSGILKKQIDGVFDLDGMLITDPSREEILYIHAYRNQFIVMNNNLAVKNAFNTIDKVSTAEIKSISLKDGTRKMGKPPLKINNYSFAHRGLLFTHSLRMGKHEAKRTWKNADVIDVYKTDSQRYIGSFYIHRKNGVKLTSFYVTDHSLYTINNNQLTKYKISGLITKYFKKGVAENPKQE